MAKLKTKEQLIAAFKKSNQERKEVLANRAGFSTPEEYLKHLEKLPDVNPITGTVEKTGKTKPVIHNVVILDASGSMDGKKFDNAVKGYNQDIKVIKEATDVTYRQTTVIFSSNKGTIKNYNVPIQEVNYIDESVQASGGTPLYRTIDETIKAMIQKVVTKDEKVLLSIFTDGGDTDGNIYLRDAQSSVELAKSLGWTITFIGTASDTNNMIRTFNLDGSNTLVHDNTAKGVQDAFTRTTQARAAYTTAVVCGVSAAELQTGFYKRKI